MPKYTKLNSIFKRSDFEKTCRECDYIIPHGEWVLTSVSSSNKMTYYCWDCQDPGG